jgi:hypothetical protein
LIPTAKKKARQISVVIEMMVREKKIVDLGWPQV